jgi:prevent-host-death family protein
MKRVTLLVGPRRPRRVSVADAKAHLSAVLRDASSAPTIIHRRGQDVAVVLGMDEYERLAEADIAGRASVRAFLEGIAELKKRRGGGVEDFTPAQAVIRPRQVL